MPFIVIKILLPISILLGLPTLALAAESHAALDLTTLPVGYLALGLFILAYAFVMTEEFTHLRKSKPVILAAGLIWMIISLATPASQAELMKAALRHNILEFAELMLFLLVAMTYINAMEERLVFESLRSWLVRKGFTYRQLFWITGILAFLISPVADNLTTALLMCAVVLAVGADSKNLSVWPASISSSRPMPVEHSVLLGISLPLWSGKKASSISFRFSRCLFPRS